MCGILGYVGEVDKESFVSALNLMTHRGPDDSGYYCINNRIHLGHRRLSIIDLNKSGSQPMFNHDKDCVCIYNGEIYNYQEIRKRLIDVGYTFDSNSDTEVLLNGYHYYGIDILNQINGMFAFALYDYRNESLIIARDRLGIKPLYFTNSEGNFYFGSEVKSLLAFDRNKRSLNRASVSSYLSHRYPVLNETFFEGIQRLNPGHYLKLQNGSLSEHKYWSLKDNLSPIDKAKTEEDYIAELNQLLKASIERRMISDVPFGAYLSGGVDSSAVVAHMSNASSKPIKTFTIGFDEDGYNEFDYANIIAERYNADHHEIMLKSDDYMNMMELLIQYKDAPLGIPNEVPLYMMSKELKKYITVVLSGEGADEIFGGYGRIFRSTHDYDVLQKMYSGEIENQTLAKKLKAKYGSTVFKDEFEHFMYLYRYTGSEEKKSLLSDQFYTDSTDDRTNKKFYQTFNEADLLDREARMMYLFEKLHLPGLLQRVDNCTMAASVEARVPFVDHKLVEFAFSVPTELKLKWNKDACFSIKDLISDEISEVHDIPKYILKKSQEPFLDHEVLYRKKMGFPVPLDRWFGGHYIDYLEDNLANGYLMEMGIIHPKIKDQLNREALEKDLSLAKTMWMLLNLEIFIHKYF